MKKLFCLFVLFSSGVFAADLFSERKVSIQKSDGECVGNVKDPLCAVDTLTACIIRKDDSLCKKLGIKKNDFDYTLGNLAEVKSNYSYRPVSIVLNKYDGVCSVHDGKTCVEVNGKFMPVDIAITTDKKFNVYLKRDKNGKLSVVWAEESECFSDEECT